MKNPHEKDELMKLFSVSASSQVQLLEQLLTSLQRFFDDDVVRVERSNQSLAQLFRRSDLPVQPVTVQAYVDHLVRILFPIQST